MPKLVCEVALAVAQRQHRTRGFPHHVLCGRPKEEEIGRAITRVKGSARGPEGDASETVGVLVLTDMFGGTPANLAVTYVSTEVEVVTGVNLPMLIKLARTPGQGDLLALARALREDGRNAIWVASDLLRGERA